jgi:hypothetical protein
MGATSGYLLPPGLAPEGDFLMSARNRRRLARAANGTVTSPRSLLVMFALLGLALAGCATGPTDPALDAMYHVGQNDAFGATQDDASLHAAAQPPAAPLTAEQQGTLDKQYAVGRNDAFGATRTTQAITAQRDYGRVVATVPMVAGKRDILGDGGAQDALAKQMYPLGTSLNDFGGKN